MARPSITPEKRAEMRSHVREAVVRLARRQKIGPRDASRWNEITIRDVIEEAGISIGTFYKYFESRDDLAQTLWAEPVGELRADMQHSLDAAAGPADRVRALLQHYVDFAIDNDRLFKGAFLGVKDGTERSRAGFDLKEEVFYRGMSEAFRDGQQQGVFRSFEPHLMAQTFWAAIHGSVALPINLNRFDFDPPRSLADNMIELLLRSILAAPPD